MNTLFDLDALETKAQAQQRKPETKPLRYWIEIEKDGKRAAYMGDTGNGYIRFMVIDTSRKQRQPHLYKTLHGAELAQRDCGGVVKVWIGTYEVQA